jgi:type II secretory ATPase GspE/PulE/Tfp pilus assembly ATPase PilB-like protein
MSFALQQTIERVLAEPSGLILVSGPTGSGKTTLLNALVGRLNNGQRSIVTAEHPVEFQLEGEGPIAQIEVAGDITFARALRSTLRLDPDVILVGEIRDTETMEIALQAAQTGHLVLATVHANSATETFSRALDLTVNKRRDAFRLAETVKLVLAQRLLDRYEGVTSDRAMQRDESDWLQVNGLGFIERIREVESSIRQGKAALVEAIAMTPALKEVIRSESLNSSDVYRLACDQIQYETLASAGIRAAQGLGCRVKDCMTCLESTTDAGAMPGLRARLARDNNLTLVQVADAIDSFCRALADGKPQPIETYLEQAREAECVTDQY